MLIARRNPMSQVVQVLPDEQNRRNVNIQFIAFGDLIEILQQDQQPMRRVGSKKSKQVSYIPCCILTALLVKVCVVFSALIYSYSR